MKIYTAPIALFCFKRLKHLQQTVNSLKSNLLCNESHLYVFSDGHKKNEDECDVKKVRQYLKTIEGFSNITIIEREYNLGLSKSIILGISEVLKKHDRVIVIEDDLEFSPHFLAYMNNALNLYQYSAEVASIHGYTYPADGNLPDTFFLKGADCWGWATWKRAWDTFEKEGNVLLKKLNERKLVKAFDFNGLVGNTNMLKDQIVGKNDSWAIRWHASCFLNNMLTLHPGKSLVKNIGFDGTGEHCNMDQVYNTQLSYESLNLVLQPVIESNVAFNIYRRFYKKIKPNFIKRVIRRMKLFLKKVALYND